MQFTATVFTVSECATAPCNAVLTLTRNNIASNVTVDFATVDGTATALSDYVATTGTRELRRRADRASASPFRSRSSRAPSRPRASASSSATSAGGATLGPYVNAEVRIVDTK